MLTKLTKQINYYKEVCSKKETLEKNITSNVLNVYKSVKSTNGNRLINDRDDVNDNRYFIFKFFENKLFQNCSNIQSIDQFIYSGWLF